MPQCRELARAGQRYCGDCHSKYMRAWRAKRRRDEQALKATVIKLRKRVIELESRVREQAE